jgi:serine O-acetyltransferase
LARHILKGIALKYSVYIGYNTEIDYGLKMPHPTGIVIGEYVKIGKNCIIFQQVTIGGSRIGDVQEKKQPRIGNNNVLFSGAKILGGITISDNVIVGANAVVLKDIPSNSVAVGIPAKITKNDRTEI